MDDAFENRLAALFDAGPEAADASEFLIAVERKLEARRARRRILGLMAAAVAAVAASVAVAGTGVSDGFVELLVSAGSRVGALLPSVGVPDMQAELGWTVIGLGLLAAGLGVNRALEEA